MFCLCFFILSFWSKCVSVAHVFLFVFIIFLFLFWCRCRCCYHSVNYECWTAAEGCTAFSVWLFSVRSSSISFGCLGYFRWSVKLLFSSEWFIEALLESQPLIWVLCILSNKGKRERERTMDEYEWMLEHFRVRIYL